MARPTRYRVEWAAVARADLEAIVKYVAKEDIVAAESILLRVEKGAKRLTRMPMRGRVLPELASFGIHTYRELIVAPWRIVYRISQRRVLVLAVLDSRRNLEDLLLERLVRA